MRFAIVIDKAGPGCSSCAPDLSARVATAASIGQVEDGICEAIRFHIEGLKEDDLPTPAPTNIADDEDA